jgi:23S rRNA pseudouridine1911/1915/1917 synthase
VAGRQPEGLITFVVEAEDAGARLDAWLAGVLPRVSRAKVKKLIEQGAVTVQGMAPRPRDLLEEGWKVVIDTTVSAYGAAEEPESGVPAKPVPVAMPLKIIYEDEHLLVLDKPVGLAVHPGAGGGGKPTLVSGLLAHVAKTGGGLGKPAKRGERDPLAELRPGIVHRLDKDTSGLLVCSKTDSVHAALAKQFLDKTKLLREYVALLDGTLAAPEVERESWLMRAPGSRVKFCSHEEPYRQGVPAPEGCRYAKSIFRRDVVYGGRLTLARVRLYTGRTHQIRIHARDIGAPVVGDQLYHRPTHLPGRTFPEPVVAAVQGVKRQLLHAVRLGFVHPVTGKPLLCEAPLPEDFKEIVDLLAPYRGGSSSPRA